MHKLRTGHLFAGAGGGILADLLLGHQPILAVEIEDYPRKILEQRQADGVLPFFPIFGDIREFDGKPWRGSVDVLCGGFPCQDISSAGKGAGITGARSGLWKEYARLIDEMRPQFVFAENSPLLRTRGLGVVLEDLASMGYDARWGIMGAWHVGAPHKRDRMWVLAYAKGTGASSDDGRLRPWTEGAGRGKAANQEDLAYASDERLQGRTQPIGYNPQGWQESHGYTPECGGLWWTHDPAETGVESSIIGEDTSTEPLVGRLAYGIPDRVGKLKALGNAQTPQCAAMAFSALSEGLI